MQMGWMAPAPICVAMRHSAVVLNGSERRGLMQITTGGLDLAKNAFQVHGITDSGEVTLNRALRRVQVLTFFERPDVCLIGVEAIKTAKTGLVAPRGCACCRRPGPRALAGPGHGSKALSPAGRYDPVGFHLWSVEVLKYRHTSLNRECLALKGTFLAGEFCAS